MQKMGQAVLSLMNGAAGGPRMDSTPGPEGMLSPIRTRGWLLMRTWLCVRGPMGKG